MPTVHDLIRQVRCPDCGAWPGRKCFRWGKRYYGFHAGRLAAYRATFVKPQVRDLFR